MSEEIVDAGSCKKFCFVLLFPLAILCACAKGAAEQTEAGDLSQDSTLSNANLHPTPTPELMVEQTALNEPPAPSTSTAEILGLVVAESDAGNVPDSPLENQLVLIMTIETAERMFGTGANFRFTQKDVPLDDRQIMTSITDADGTFSASVPPREMVLCLADEFSNGVATPSGVATTRGCGQFTAHLGPNTLTVSVGYGEILLDTG